MADQFTIDPPAKPAGLDPARVLPNGFTIEGPPGSVHTDLGAKVPEEQRYFIDQGGKVLDRKDAAPVAAAAGVDTTDSLHSEDLQAARFRIEPPKKGFLDNALAPVKDIIPTYQRKAKETTDEMAGGVQRIKKGEVLGGIKDTALGALGYVGSPLDAPIEALLSKPLENATGIPKDATTAAVEILGPGALTKAGRLAAGKTLSGVKDLASGTTVEKMLSPTTVDASAGGAEDTTRSAIGTAERDTARTEAELAPHRKTLAQHLPEFQTWLNADPAGRALMAKPKILDMIDYMEGRSKGAKLATPELQRAADDIRKGNEFRKAKYQALPSTTQAGAIEDYFVHEWENPQAAAKFASDFIGKQGSGRNLKARSYPTISDGLQAGLKLKTADPIESTLRYTANMDRFLANNEIVDNMRGNGEAKYFRPGQQPNGWMEMKGRLSQKITPVGPMKLYAPEGAATVYNNFISRGFAEIGPNAGKAFDAVQHTANSVTALKLGLSGFHATTMANEAIINDVARAVGQAGRGDLLRAAKTAGMAITAPVKTYQHGRELIGSYLKDPTARNGSLLDKIADLGTNANMRVLKRDPSMFASGKGSYWQSYKNGTLGQELKASLRNGMTVAGAVPEATKNAGRLLDTIAAPLFDKYIPTLKAGAFYDNMADWLRANPAATEKAQQQAAKAIWDSIDNRFGELVQDNLFWNKTGKQIAQVLTLSPTWNIGTIREIGGGVKDIATGKGLTERAKYVVALPIVTGVTGSIMQFLKTGQAPDDKTLLGLYKTGGENYDGSEERAMVPGYMKDVLGYAHDPLAEVQNKANPALSLGADLIRNQDYRGLPIANPTENSTLGERLRERGEFIGEQAAPISIESLLHRKEGTNISIPEQLLGVRPAPMYEQNPQTLKALTDKTNTTQWRRKRNADKRARNREGKE